MPWLTGGPFGYRPNAESLGEIGLHYAHVPVMQAVISPSALSVLQSQDSGACIRSTLARR